MMIKITNVSKTFEGHKVLDGISFELNLPDSLAIIGPSGGGKTTIAKILAGIEQPDKDYGNLSIDGKVGFVFQEFNLFPHMTAMENICYAPVNAHGQKKEDVEIFMNHIAEKFLIKEHLHKYPRDLSGGQKQRVAILRAMVLKPSIIILDEPTASLDPSLVGNLVEVVNDLKKMGVSVVVVTHDLTFAESVSNHVLFLLNGKVEDFGKTAQLFKYFRQNKDGTVEETKKTVMEEVRNISRNYTPEMSVRSRKLCRFIEDFYR